MKSNIFSHHTSHKVGKGKNIWKWRNVIPSQILYSGNANHIWCKQANAFNGGANGQSRCGDFQFAIFWRHYIVLVWWHAEIDQPFISFGSFCALLGLRINKAKCALVGINTQGKEVNSLEGYEGGHGLQKFGTSTGK